jgi:hypothetical protein
MLDDLNGSVINLVKRPGVAAGNRIGIPSGGKGMRIAHGANAAGDNRHGRAGKNCKNRFLHIENRATEKPPRVKPVCKSKGLEGPGELIGMDFAAFRVAVVD